MYLSDETEDADDNPYTKMITVQMTRGGDENSPMDVLSGQYKGAPTEEG